MISTVPSVSSVHVELDGRLPSTAGRTDVTSKRETEFSRMGGYNFPGQIAASDGSEGNGSMVAGFIVLKNPRQQDLSVWAGQKRVRRPTRGSDWGKRE